MAIGTRLTNRIVVSSLVTACLAVWAQESEASRVLNSVSINAWFLIGVEAGKPYEFRLYRAYVPFDKDASSVYLAEIIQHGHQPIHYTFKSPSDKPSRVTEVRSIRSNLALEFSGVEYRFLESRASHYIDDPATPIKHP